MTKDLTKQELEALGLSCDADLGIIYLNGEAVSPVCAFGHSGLRYPRINVYDRNRYSSTIQRLRHPYGTRPISAARIVWAWAYGIAPGNRMVKAINGNPFDLRIENLMLVSRRKNYESEHD